MKTTWELMKEELKTESPLHNEGKDLTNLQVHNLLAEYALQFQVKGETKSGEEEAKIWIELINDPEWFNMKHTTNETLEYFKSKFEIKRKNGI